MRRLALIVGLILTVALIQGVLAQSAEPTTPSQQQAMTELGGVMQLWVHSLSIAVAPIWGMAVVATQGYYATPEAERDHLSFFFRPACWMTLWVLTGLLLLKDTLLTVFSVLKIPLDALAVFLQSFGGVIGVVVALMLLFNAFELMAVGWPARLLAVVTLVVFYALLFITFAAIDIFVMINPVPFIDMALALIRVATMGAFFVAAEIHPILGLVVVLPVVLVSAWSAGKTMRFSICGLVFASDLIFSHKNRSELPESGVLAFAGRAMPGVATNRRGYLVQSPQGGLCFQPKRLLGRASTTVEIPTPETAGLQLTVGSISASVLYPSSHSSKKHVLFRLPPRYRRREQEVADALGLEELVDISIRAGLKSLIRNLYDRSESVGLGSNSVRKSISS